MTNIKMGLTIEEAAEMSGIGRNTMRKLVDWGKLPVLKVGRKTIIRRDALENFMTVNQGRTRYTRLSMKMWVWKEPINPSWPQRPEPGN